MNILWHPWAHLDLRNCCRRTVYFIELNAVRWQQFRSSRWAQGGKADSGHRLFMYYPKRRLIPLAKIAACSKCAICGLNLLHNPELILNRRTVAATPLIAPGHDGCICQNCNTNAPCVAWICCIYPRSRRIHLPRSQQMRAAWLSPPKPALYPRWRRIHLQEYAVQPWADLEPQNCHRQSLHYPRSRRIILPKLQQMRAAWPEAVHAWADFEPQNCRQILHYPRWRLRYLHETTRHKPVLLLQLVA